MSSPRGEVGKTVTIWNGTLAKSIMVLVSFLFCQPSHGILISIMCLHVLKRGRGGELQCLDITTDPRSTTDFHNFHNSFTNVLDFSSPSCSTLASLIV